MNEIERTDRRAELAANLAGVNARIEAACAAAGRPRGDVQLIAVTKYFPASDVDLLAGLGITAIGESKDQEAQAKIAGISSRSALTVHFVGQVQTNKARHVASYADVVQSVDRDRLVSALARGAESAQRIVEVLVQVDLDGATGRGGVVPGAARQLAAQIAGEPALRLRGVMAVAPRGQDPAPAFERLRALADGIRNEHPDATWISAGMSGDLEQAVAAGATHLRVGTAILGSRLSLG